MDLKSLSTDMETRQRTLVQRDRQLQVAQRQATELSVTVQQQSRQLAAVQQKIVELLRTLPLFELGELELFIEEQAADAEKSTRRRKRKRGRRLVPEDAPRKEVFHEFPDSERLCPHDGQLMPVIR